MKQVPELGSVEQYLKDGPGFIFLFNPALGERWLPAFWHDVLHCCMADVLHGCLASELLSARAAGWLAVWQLNCTIMTQPFWFPPQGRCGA